MTAGEPPAPSEASRIVCDDAADIQCPIAFGSGPIGNLFAPLNDAEARTAIDRAWELGIRRYDTAPHYGRGLSERRIGDALRTRSGYTVSTKVGRMLLPDRSIDDDHMRDGFRSPMPFRTEYDYSRDGIMRSHEASLHRLGLGYIDHLFIHDIGVATHGDRNDARWAELTTGGGLAALDRLRGEGTVAGIGVGVNEVDACLRMLDMVRLDTVMIAGRYTLLDTSAFDTLLDTCLATGAKVLVAAPLNSGILATGVDGASVPWFDYAPAPPAIIERVRAIEHVALRYAVPLPAAAMQFPVAHPAVAQVVTGFRSAQQVTQAVAWMRHPIPAGFWADLKSDGLLREEAPVPGETAWYPCPVADPESV